jgi:hypothetical protein
MRPFTYERATDAKGAVKAAAETPNARFIAGGTNLLDLMKLEIERPAHLIDVGRLPLAAIEDTAEGGLRIGAMASNSHVAADARVRSRYSVLTQAIVAAYALDRGHRIAVVHHRQRQAAVDPPPVDQHGARAALAVVASLLRSRQLQMLAQCIEQGGAGVEGKGAFLSIHDE